MKYYLTADGGGSKLLVILYDENFHILRSVRTTGTNSSFKPKEQVAEEVEKLSIELFSDEIGETVKEIESLDMSIVGDAKVVLEAMKRRVTIHNYHVWDEGKTPLGATGVLYGCVAQAGTGSDAFLIQPDGNYFVGGMGALLGDEGSGYDIGLRTLKAAIYADDGRGPMTRILPLLNEYWNLKHMWDLVNRLIHEPDYRRVVASASYITEMAALEGDEIALSIYEDAGHEMAKQVLAVLRKTDKPLSGPIVTSGGAWKGHPRMFETFCREVRAEYPDVEITYPIFEPVVGCVILRILSEGIPFEETKNILMKEFSEFLYQHK